MDSRHIVKRGRLATLATLAIALAASSAPPPAAAASHVTRALSPTSKDPDAHGRASLLVRKSHGKLKIAAQRLTRSSSFEVVVDTVRIGTLATGPGGSGKARFSTTPRGHEQLLGVDPRGKLVEVRDQEGDDVLETEMPDDSPPGAIRCCIADDEETECEPKTPTDCDAAHGVNMGDGSCVPNPCAPTTPPDHVRCCIPDHDEDGPKCEDTTADECSRQGGVNVGAGECGGNDCGPTPPPSDQIRCCVPQQDEHAGQPGDGEDGGEDSGDHGGAEPPDCERLTADACTALHGTSLGAGSCDPNPCAASPSGAFVGEATTR